MELTLLQNLAYNLSPRQLDYTPLNYIRTVDPSTILPPKLKVPDQFASLEAEIAPTKFQDNRCTLIRTLIMAFANPEVVSTLDMLSWEAQIDYYNQVFRFLDQEISRSQLSETKKHAIRNNEDDCYLLEFLANYLQINFLIAATTGNTIFTPTTGLSDIYLCFYEVNCLWHPLAGANGASYFTGVEIAGIATTILTEQEKLRTQNYLKSKLTIAQLHQLAREYGLEVPVKAKKAELVQLLYDEMVEDVMSK